MKHRWLLAGIALMVMACAITAFAQTPPTYTLTDLGSLGGYSASPTGINNNGCVAGWSYLPNGLDHAFYWTPATGMIDLGALGTTPGSLKSVAYGLNDANEVVGKAYTAKGPQRAFLWQDANGNGQADSGEMRDITGKDYTEARAINNNRQVVGNYITGGLGVKAFLWEGDTGRLTYLPVVKKNAGSIVYALNHAGVATGVSGDSAVVWSGSTVTPLPAPAGTYGGIAQSLNEAGDVVGVCNDPVTGSTRFPVLWAKTDFGYVPTLLSNLAGGVGRALSINRARQIVGWSWAAPDGNAHAVLWDSDGTHDLNDLST